MLRRGDLKFPRLFNWPKLFLFRHSLLWFHAGGRRRIASGCAAEDGAVAAGIACMFDGLLLVEPTASGGDRRFAARAIMALRPILKGCLLTLPA